MILRGWKKICAALDGISEPIARDLMRKEGLPVVMVAGKPMSTTEKLSGWVEEKCQENSCSLRRNQPQPAATERNQAI